MDDDTPPARPTRRSVTGPGSPDDAAARWLRSIRCARRLSQRELAALAQVPRSTVDRIEAGRTDPRFSTFVRVCDATGYALVLMDHRGRMCLVPPVEPRPTDRGGRVFPAHLEFGRTPGYFEMGRHWWGWHCIAWPFNDDWVPPNTYWRRNAPPRFGVWDDAT